jgi:tetratricopeptide (TPR) repeat protein
VSPPGNARWGIALAEKTSQSAAESTADAAATPSGVRALAQRIGAVAVVHWKRAIAAALTVVVLMGGIGMAWTYMVNLAIAAERAKLDQALKALDEGNYEQARVLVRQVLASGTLPRDQFGIPLYVLGAVKTYDADHEPIREQARTQYLVASRYLSKASSYGFPAKREKQALLLWGKSLVESFETEQGIEVLQDALAVLPRTGGQLNVAIHRLLAEAYARPPQTQDKLALEQLAAVLADSSTTDDQRTDALLLKAKILARTNRYDEALQSLAQISAARQRDPLVLLARGQTLLDGVAAALDRLPIQADGALPKELNTRVEDAVTLLREAQSLDEQGTDVTRRAYYLLGRAAALGGDEREALKYFSRTQQQFGDTPEALASKLSEADILRRAGDDATALLWYRQILQLGLEPAAYRSEVLPIDQLRRRLLEALADFVRRGQFAGVIAMLDNFPPLFPKTQELELRGKTLREWGDRLVRQATDQGKNSRELRRTGLLRLREAGVAYEALAALRFATANYPTDLWNSADCFYLGHSYTHAARLLNLYLESEPERLNSQALLRLGQVNLALGRIDESIDAFQECIELYDRDNATYQARIECAKAFWRSGDPKEAERLLRVNLFRSLLGPESPEWKDSLFSLGMLQFEQGRYDDAIGTLEEAVKRYPEDRQTLQARYVIGEANRRWADEPRGRLETARTASEREKLEALIRERLAAALEQFKRVQSSITLKIENVQDDGPYAAMRRNCYMLEGACLFDLGRYQEAIEAYQNVSSLYPNEPFVLETFVQIANCWQRLDRPENAHGAIQQAQITLEQLPGTADFASTTAFSREEWQVLLNNMSQW